MTIQTIGGGTDSMQVAQPPGSGIPAKLRGDTSAVSNTSQPQPDTKAASEVSSKELEATLEKFRQAADLSSSSLSFSIDHDTGKTVVRVTDQATGQLIRQIPSQEMIDLAKSIDQMRGILIRKQA
jgi:flagellar protein FlaG